jgi:hypothetical protein
VDGFAGVDEAWEEIDRSYARAKEVPPQKTGV